LPIKSVNNLRQKWIFVSVVIKIVGCVQFPGLKPIVLKVFKVSFKEMAASAGFLQSILSCVGQP